MSQGLAPAVTVRLPAPLRDRTDKRAAVRASGATVHAVIDDLERQFPGMRFALCEETGALRPFVNVFLNGENVRDLDGLSTPVSEGAEVYVLHSVAGGS
jgi:molybdopterin synthase sulfur carrier subunit